MRGIHWWYIDKKQRLFMSLGHSATHIKKGEGDWFMRSWYHKIEHKRIFISMKEQKEMGIKKITRKEARRLMKLNDTQLVKDYGFAMNKEEVKKE